MLKKYLLESIPNSSQVSGGLVRFTEKPVIGVPCEKRTWKQLPSFNCKYASGSACKSTVGVNNGRNAAVLSGEILSINNPVLFRAF